MASTKQEAQELDGKTVSVKPRVNGIGTFCQQRHWLLTNQAGEGKGGQDNRIGSTLPDNDDDNLYLQNT